MAKWRLKQFDGAVADFTKAVSLNPDYAPAYNNRGNVYMDLNRVEEAYRDFDKAIALSPGFGPAYSNRANASQKLRRLEAAENDFRKAIELMPGSAVPLNGRGKIASSPGPLLHRPALSQPGHCAERTICVRLSEQGCRLHVAEPERGCRPGLG